MDQAIKHCTAGLGIWEWASERQGLRTRCRHGLLRRRADAGDTCRGRDDSQACGVERVVNIVSSELQPESEHPHGLSDGDFDALFTKDKPVIFAFHGYPWLIHRLTYRRTTTEHPRTWLQGGRHDDDAVRHGRHERSGPLQPVRGRGRPRRNSAGPRISNRRFTEADRAQSTSKARRRHARDRGWK